MSCEFSMLLRKNLGRSNNAIALAWQWNVNSGHCRWDIVFKPPQPTFTSVGAVKAFSTLENKAHCNQLHLRERKILCFQS